MGVVTGASHDGGPALRRLLDVVLRLGAERRTEPVLRDILDAARELAGARYAAIGVPDGDGGFALFLTAGVDAQTWERIGALPRTHGLLGVLVSEPSVIRLADIRADPRFGYYPHAHPQMRSFLGVPIMAGGEIVAGLYLTEKGGGTKFSDADQELIETLAGHAALADPQGQGETRKIIRAASGTMLSRPHRASKTGRLRPAWWPPAGPAARRRCRVMPPAWSRGVRAACVPRTEVSLPALTIALCASCNPRGSGSDVDGGQHDGR